MAAAQQDDRMKALNRALVDIERAFGKGSVMKLGEHMNADGIEVISTGSIGLDVALGVGGVPKGRVVEIYGPEASGKTTLALHIVAEAQKKGGLAAYIDAEHALDPDYARKLGVDIDNLFISQPDSGEQALEICDQLVKSGALDIVVIDSVAALVPKAEIDGEMGDSHMGLQARLMSQALRKMTATIGRNNTCVVFINQIRMKIGVMFGNPETTTGGNALKFYSSVRLEVRSGQSIKGSSGDVLPTGKDDEGGVVGKKTKVKVVKNKVAPPLKVANFDIMYGEGISRAGELIELGTSLEIIQKSGSWYSYKDSRLGQGAENVKKLLMDNPELADEIEGLIRGKLGLSAT
jgi:recombination protein RecA